MIAAAMQPHCEPTLVSPCARPACAATWPTASTPNLASLPLAVLPAPPCACGAQPAWESLAVAGELLVLDTASLFDGFNAAPGSDWIAGAVVLLQYVQVRCLMHVFVPAQITHAR